MPATARRFLERFALVSLGLYHIPLFLNNYPSIGGGSGGFSPGLAISWGHVFTVPGIWLARAMFGMTGPMTEASAGDNGDVGEEWARLFAAIVIGLLVAAVWTWRDREQPRAPWTEGALCVMLRYSIALGLISYGVAKLLPQQFPPLTTMSYETRVGELAPMRLLGFFMQYSRPYNFFAGVAECTAALLLCFRRTATLGALATIVVMSNVALMNWFYDVPVKLYSTMLVVSAVVLVLYDSRRLLAVFIRNEAASAASQPTVFEGKLSGAARAGIKAVLVGSVTLSSVIAFKPNVPGRGAAQSAEIGPWGVTAFSREAKKGDTTVTPGWRRIIVDRGAVSMRLDNDLMMRCRRTLGGDSTAIVFTCSRDRKGELRWSVAGTTLTLDGTFDGARTTATARRLDEKDYPLMKGGSTSSATVSDALGRLQLGGSGRLQLCVQRCDIGFHQRIPPRTERLVGADALGGRGDYR